MALRYFQLSSILRSLLGSSILVVDILEWTPYWPMKDWRSKANQVPLCLSPMTLITTNQGCLCLLLLHADSYRNYCYWLLLALAAVKCRVRNLGRERERTVGWWLSWLGERRFFRDWMHGLFGLIRCELEIKKKLRSWYWYAFYDFVLILKLNRRTTRWC